MINDFSNIMVVDGVQVQTSEFYTFENSGEHTVGLNLVDNTEIPDYAFKDCDSLTSIVINNTITTIGCEAFYSCSGLTEITIPDSVEYIDDRAFYSCGGLESITCEATVPPTLGEDVFSGTECLIYVPSTSVNAYKAAENWGDYDSQIVPIGYVEPKVTCYYIAEEPNQYIDICNSESTSQFKTCIIDDVEQDSIPYQASFEQTGIHKVEFILDNTTEIGDSTFSVGNLYRVEISDSVTSIGESAFQGWQLTSVTLGSGVTSIGNYAFSGCEQLTSINIPNNVTTIGENAFADCYNLTSISIPASVESIGDRCFNGCMCLNSITVDSNNQYYDNRNNCNAIIETSTNTLIQGCNTTIIPNTVTSIGNYAFHHCNGATYLTIGNGVTSIGNSAFSGCTKLDKITIYATTPPTLANDTVFETIRICPIYVPSTSVNIYKARWRTYANRIQPIT